jgi:pilus assembly protein CpaC
MHRTLPRTRTFWWGSILALVACAALGVGQACAQQPPPARGIVVPINGTKVLPLASKKLITRIQVENPAVVRANPSADAKAVMFTGLLAGRTIVTITDADNGQEAFEVVVQSDIEYLRYMLRKAAPTANVEPIPSAGNTFILTGSVAKSEDIPIILATAQSVVGGGIVNALRVGGVMQVELDVVIAQVSRSELRQLGFSFINTGNEHFITSVLTSPNTTNLTNTIAPSAVTGLLNSAPNLAYGFVNDKTGFLGFLQALRTEGLAKFLAEPRLVTLTGKPAYFQSGGKLAVPQPSGLGTNAVAFEPFGTQLSFLPIVLGNGKIYLEIEPVVDTVDQTLGTTIAGTTVPGFDTQRLHATVEMEPGQTFALGGLIQNTVNASATKVPVLGDLPFLNFFFSFKSYNETETELLVLVTPHLVDPMACDQLPKYLPGQETRSPDDFELFLEGILEAPRGQREVWTRGHYTAAYLNGPTGSALPCANGACRASGYGGGCGGGCGAGCGSGNCGRSYDNHSISSTPAAPASVAADTNPAPASLPSGTPTQGRPAPESEGTVPAAPGVAGSRN